MGTLFVDCCVLCVVCYVLCVRRGFGSIAWFVVAQVQDGTYVSSMVEDASFLVQKSLTRSVSTRSEQAIMAVCNRVTEVRRLAYYPTPPPTVFLMSSRGFRVQPWLASPERVPLVG